MKIVQDVDRAILVMRDAGKWLTESGKNPSKWWQLKNLNRKFLFQYAKPEEFYVLLINKKPAAAAILQLNKNESKPVYFIHWLCVTRKFAGKNLPKIIVDFAAKLAKKKNINLL